MPIQIQAKERIYLTKWKTFLEIYQEDSIVKLLVFFQTIVFAIIGTLIMLLTNSYETYIIGQFLFISSFIFTLTIGVYLTNKKIKTTKSDILIDNNKNEEYLINMGQEVIEHLGNAPKSSISENLTNRQLLLHAETIKRMMAVVGKPGSGKTVLLKGMFEQQLGLGGGGFVIDAKGTADEIKRFYAMVYKYGREKDLFILNFGNMNNTHTINFLGAGSPLILKEIMMVLSSTDDPHWRQVAEDFIESVLKLLVFKRDNEGLMLTLDEIKNYMVLGKLLKEAWKYRKVNRVEVIDFVRYVCSSIEVDYLEFKEAKENDNRFYESCETNSKNSDFQGVYEAGLAQKNWNSILTTLGSNYGNIFNVKDPDIDLFEVVKNNKIILVSLPTLESSETAKKIGKLLLGIIKSVGSQKAQKSQEPKIPFLLLLDEFGAIAIKGFGRFMSQARSLGMSMILFFQSIAQLDEVDEGKGLERKEILDMCSTYACLKNTDYELAEHLSKTVPKDIFLEMGYKEVKSQRDAKNDMGLGAEHDYQKVEEDAIKSEYMAKMNNGEMYFVAGAEAYKSISVVPTDFNLSYKEKVLGNKLYIPLLQLYPKRKLIEILSKKKSSIFIKSYLYQYSLEQINNSLQKSVKKEIA